MSPIEQKYSTIGELCVYYTQENERDQIVHAHLSFWDTKTEIYRIGEILE